MRLLVTTAVSSVLLFACGCSPVRNVTFRIVDAQSGFPLPGARAERIVPRVSAPWSWLLLPGGVAPDVENRDADGLGEVRFDNVDGCWYRVRVDGYKDFEIGQHWLWIRSWSAHQERAAAPEDAIFYRIEMQRLEQ